MGELSPREEHFVHKPQEDTSLLECVSLSFCGREQDLSATAIIIADSLLDEPDDFSNDHFSDCTTLQERAVTGRSHQRQEASELEGVCSSAARDSSVIAASEEESDSSQLVLGDFARRWPGLCQRIGGDGDSSEEEEVFPVEVCEGGLIPGTNPYSPDQDGDEGEVDPVGLSTTLQRQIRLGHAALSPARPHLSAEVATREALPSPSRRGLRALYALPADISRRFSLKQAPPSRPSRPVSCSQPPALSASEPPGLQVAVSAKRRRVRSLSPTGHSPPRHPTPHPRSSLGRPFWISHDVKKPPEDEAVAPASRQRSGNTDPIIPDDLEAFALSVTPAKSKAANPDSTERQQLDEWSKVQNEVGAPPAPRAAASSVVVKLDQSQDLSLTLEQLSFDDAVCGLEEDIRQLQQQAEGQSPSLSGTARRQPSGIDGVLPSPSGSGSAPWQSSQHPRGLDGVLPSPLGSGSAPWQSSQHPRGLDGVLPSSCDSGATPRPFSFTSHGSESLNKSVDLFEGLDVDSEDPMLAIPSRKTSAEEELLRADTASGPFVLSPSPPAGLVAVDSGASQEAGCGGDTQAQGTLHDWIVDVEAEALGRFPLYETTVRESPPDVLLRDDDGGVDVEKGSSAGSSPSPSPRRELEALALTQCAPLRRKRQGQVKRLERAWDSGQWYRKLRALLPRLPRTRDSCVDSGTPSPKLQQSAEAENLEPLSAEDTGDQDHDLVPVDDQRVPERCERVEDDQAGCSLGTCCQRRLDDRPMSESDVYEGCKVFDEHTYNWNAEQPNTTPRAPRPASLRLGLSKRARPKPLHFRKQWWVLRIIKQTCSLQ